MICYQSISQTLDGAVRGDIDPTVKVTGEPLSLRIRTLLSVHENRTFYACIVANYGVADLFVRFTSIGPCTGSLSRISSPAVSCVFNRFVTMQHVLRWTARLLVGLLLIFLLRCSRCTVRARIELIRRTMWQ